MICSSEGCRERPFLGLRRAAALDPVADFDMGRSERLPDLLAYVPMRVLSLDSFKASSFYDSPVSFNHREERNAEVPATGPSARHWARERSVGTGLR